MAFASLRRLAGVAFACAAIACRPSAYAADAPQPDRTVDMAEVLQPGPLPELAIGDRQRRADDRIRLADLPALRGVRARTRCRNCKKAYIDTGKVRYIFREFSRNPLDVAAFVLARCLGDDKALARRSNCCSPSRTNGRSSTSRSSR